MAGHEGAQCLAHNDKEDPVSSPPEYGDTAFWEAYYSSDTHGDGPAREEPEVYDWLFGWPEVSWLLESLLGHNPRRSVLHLGCGNSTLAEDFYDAGYQHQTCVDCSSAAIARMQQRNEETRPGIRWIAADATDLGDLPNDTFDLVIEKCTLDALFCHDDHALMIGKFVKEAFRVLAPGGAFVSLGYHPPARVRPFLHRRCFGWRVRVVELHSDGDQTSNSTGRPLYNRIYAHICANKRTTNEALRCWPVLLERLEAHPGSDLSDEDSETSAEDTSGDDPG